MYSGEKPPIIPPLPQTQEEWRKFWYKVTGISMGAILFELDLFMVAKEIGVPVEFRGFCLILTALITIIPVKLAQREDRE